MMILLATVILSTVLNQVISTDYAPVKVTRSADESLRDRGTYIICFQHHVTGKELQKFVAALSRRSAKEENFTVEIIAELFIMKCLTARLSGRALSWVRIVWIVNDLIITGYTIYYGYYRTSVMNLYVCTLSCDHYLLYNILNLGYTLQDNFKCKRK